MNSVGNSGPANPTWKAAEHSISPPEYTATLRGGVVFNVSPLRLCRRGKHYHILQNLINTDGLSDFSQPKSGTRCVVTLTCRDHRTSFQP